MHKRVRNQNDTPMVPCCKPSRKSVRLIYYSLSIPTDQQRSDLFLQLIASIRSLRTYNQSIPIYVFVYGHLPDELERQLGTYQVQIYSKEEYSKYLSHLFPRGWEALSHYPLLHKWLNFTEIDTLHPTQVLYLDCDTFFFDDVDILFDTYSSLDCYAREEPTCQRSHHGYDPTYLNEELLLDLTRHEQIIPVPPFNLGVVMLNNGIWSKINHLQSEYLLYTWRFMVWMALNPIDEQDAQYGEGQGISLLRTKFSQLVSNEDVTISLPFPSGNRWILDQVALWLTLGWIPNFTYGDFSMRQVLQNGECMDRRIEECDWIMCHYYSQNLERFDQWIKEYNTRIQHPRMCETLPTGTES